MNLRHFLTMGMWIAPVLLQLLIVTIMIQRGLVRQFKYFFTYSVCAPAHDVTLLFLHNHPNLYAFYFWIYWAGDGLLILLQVAVLCEAFWCLVPLHAGFRLVAMRILRAVVALSAGFAFVLFAIAVTSSGESIEVILLLERSARVIQVMMLVVAMVFISHLGLTWRQYATGILLGSGIGGLQLVLAELRGNLHLISNEAFVWLRPAVYDFAVIVWAIYFIGILPRSPTIALTEGPQADLSEWDEALKGYLYRQW